MLGSVKDYITNALAEIRTMGEAATERKNKTEENFKRSEINDPVRIVSLVLWEENTGTLKQSMQKRARNKMKTEITKENP